MSFSKNLLLASGLVIAAIVPAAAGDGNDPSSYPDDRYPAARSSVFIATPMMRRAPAVRVQTDDVRGPGLTRYQEARDMAVTGA